ncbi:MAG: hypothetical protein APF81_19700 [Desulfosporosinus sp. BRH_c37]|nr:MAG: hypothetical protein APF81_19700 [Desulfosporosinus sp. BRH_c37]
MAGRKAYPASLMLATNDKNRLTKEQLENRLQNEPKPKSSVLTTPSWLRSDAKNEWERIVGLFRDMDDMILSDLDTNALEIYCESVVTYRKAMAKVRESNEVYVSKDDPNHPKRNPWLSVANEAAMQVKKYGEVLCLDPVSRARVGLGKSRKDFDPNADMFGD